MQTSGAEATSSTKDQGLLWRKILRAAWLSILLGLAIEASLLGAAAAYGTFQSVPQVLADSLQKVSWSFLVCVGLACGSVAAKAAPVMGLLGLLAAPLAFAASRALHKSAQHALNVASQAGVGPSVWAIAGLKGLEYAALGALLGWLGQRKSAGLVRFLMVGLAVGLVFGGAILWLTVQRAQPALTTPSVVVRGLNELLFPIGCSFVLFVTSSIGASMHARK